MSATSIEERDGTTTITFGEPAGGRRCGDCQLCCKLLPVSAFHKPAGVKCKFQKAGKGCRIYTRKPFDCTAFSCRWLIDRLAARLPRPDRAHYVIDMMLDEIRLTPHEGGEPIMLSVVQVWVDPAFPDAHRAPELRAYLAGQGRPALIRYGSRSAFTLFPPAMTDDGQWHEKHGSIAEDVGLFAALPPAERTHL